MVQTFGALSGEPLWSVRLPREWSFTSPPVARGGVLYTAGSGIGGILYAVSEHDGQVLFEEPVENGDRSSPAVAGAAVYASYSCQQAYAFDRLSGALVWRHDGPCEGAGGTTPMLAGGRLLVEDGLVGNVFLSRRTGAAMGTFAATALPAAWHGELFLPTPGTLTAQTADGTVAWRFRRDPDLDTAPLVVNGVVFAASASGVVYGLDGATGKQLWSSATRLADIAQSGLAAGDGMLLVPAQDRLLAYRAAS